MWGILGLPSWLIFLIYPGCTDLSLIHTLTHACTHLHAHTCACTQHTRARVGKCTRMRTHLHLHVHTYAHRISDLLLFSPVLEEKIGLLTGKPRQVMRGCPLVVAGSTAGTARELSGWRGALGKRLRAQGAAPRDCPSSVSREGRCWGQSAVEMWSRRGRGRALL